MHLLFETTWLVAGGAAALAVAVAVAVALVLRKSGRDYSINRNEGGVGFDLGAQQRELELERARLDAERKRAERAARQLGQDAADALKHAAEDQGRELAEMAASTAPPLFTPPPLTQREKQMIAEREALIAKNDAEAQALIREQRALMVQKMREQEQEIERVRQRHERALQAARAALQRGPFDAAPDPAPRPEIAAPRTPLQSLADTMQASYAQVGWAFEALARKLD